MAESDQVVEPGSEPTPTPDPKQSQKEETYKVTIDGKEQELDRSKLIELAQKGGDYTKKTQDLATQRANLKPMEDIFQLVKENPELASELDEVIKGYYSKSEAELPEGELLKRVSELEAQHADIELDREMTLLESKYKDSGFKFDRIEVAEFCNDNGIADPESGFIKMIGTDGFEKAAEERVAAKIKAKENSGLFPPKPGSKSTPELDVTNMSDQDKDKTALKMLKRR